MRTKRKFTVIGFIKLDSHELLVAAVLEGEHTPVDQGYSPSNYQKWAETYECSWYHEAIDQAITAVEGPCDDHDGNGSETI
jgi:thiaminase